MTTEVNKKPSSIYPVRAPIPLAAAALSDEQISSTNPLLDKLLAYLKKEGYENGSSEFFAFLSVNYNQYQAEQIAETFLFLLRNDIDIHVDFWISFHTIENAKNLKDVLLAYANVQPKEMFLNWDKYANDPNRQRRPWALEVLTNAAYMAGATNDSSFSSDWLEYLGENIFSEDDLNELVNQGHKDFLFAETITKQDVFQPNPARLLFDPYTRNVSKVNRDWLKGLNIPASQASDNILSAIRALNFDQKQINKDNVVAMMKQQLQLQQEFGNVHLFKSRNCFVLADNQKIFDLIDEDPANPLPSADVHSWSDKSEDDFRFGKKRLFESIQKQAMIDGGAAELRRFSTEELDDKTWPGLKEKLIQDLINIAPPFTLLFDGHGMNGLIEISGIGGKYYDLSVEDVARIYRGRFEKYNDLAHATPDKRDILIFGACHGANFFRRLQELLGEQAGPIMISTAEYGQFGYSTLSNPYGSGFFEQVLGLGIPNSEPATINSFIKNQHRSNANPILSVPVLDNSGLYKYRQIAQAKNILQANRWT